MKLLKVLLLYILTEFIFCVLDYTGANWPDSCKGNRQSPIDFTNSFKYKQDSDYIKLLERNYDNLSGQLSLRNQISFGFNITDQVTLWVEKNSIKYKYNLIDIHIHVLSEIHLMDIMLILKCI